MQTGYVSKNYPDYHSPHFVLCYCFNKWDSRKNYPDFISETVDILLAHLQPKNAQNIDI